MSNYWLFAWLDAEGIRTSNDARRYMRNDRSFGNLVLAAESHLQDSAVGSHGSHRGVLPIPEARQQLVAGQGLDLSGVLDCNSAACMKKRVDQSIYRSWHYFDNIVVTGLGAAWFIEALKHEGAAKLRQLVFWHIEVALYIRQIGAEKIFIFSNRPGYCLNHLRQHAQEAGILGSIEDVAARLGHLLQADCKVRRMDESPVGIEYEVNFPSIASVGIGTYHRRPIPESPELLAKLLAQDTGRALVARLIADAAFARINEAALGQVVASLDYKLGSNPPSLPTSSDVAFNLSLPMIENLPIPELLSVRHHEAAEFQAFRKALRLAISERLAALPQSDAESVADSVYEDVLEPTLIALDRKLNKAAELFTKKSIATVSVGAAATTVGLLAFPHVIAAGLAVVVGGELANYLTLLNDQKEIELSDLYFLWRLTDKAAAHVS